MSEQINWKAVLEFALEGAKESAEGVSDITDAIDELGRKSAVTEKELAALTRAAVKASSGTGGRSVDNDNATKYDNEALAVARLETAQRALKKSYESVDNANMITDVSRLSSAQTQLTSAYSAQTAAVTRLNAATESGNKKLVMLETNNLTRANNDVTTSIRAVNAANNETAGRLPAMRYALYDVSTQAAATGVALTALSLAPTAMAVSMDRAFADVQRTTETTGSAATDMRAEFEELYRSLPTDWASITNIGSLAGQLNIAAGSVAEFTSLVTKFAATTDVTVEASATAFGRLSTVLDVPASEFENLGSSILKVGVNSVATETQIINISTQIASMAAYANISAADVFGLSAALASLGTQPELARGTITRLFSQIDMAVGQSGDKLDNFARLTGMSADEFSAAWGSEGGSIDVIQRLMTGLDNVTASGESAFSALSSIGITADRDTPTLLRLAQNSDLLAQSLADANQGYDEGTALQEQYSIIASTTAEKLTILGNNFKNLIENIDGLKGPLSLTVDVLIEFLGWLNEIVDNPVTGWVVGLVSAMALIGGVLSLVIAGITRAVGGFTALYGVVKVATASMAGFTASTVNAAAGAAATSTTVRGTAASMLALAAGTNVANTALKALLVTTGVGLGLVALSTVVSGLGAAFQSAEQQAEDFLGPVDSLSEALKLDTEAANAGAEAIAYHSVAMAEGEKATISAEQSTKNWIMSQDAAAAGADNVTSSLGSQVVAFGEASKAAMAASLAANKSVQDLANNPELTGKLKTSGFEVGGLIDAALKGDGGGKKYVTEVISEMERLRAAVEGVPTIAPVTDYSTINAMADALDEQSAAALRLATTQDFVSQAMGEAADEMDNTAAAAANASAAVDELNDALFGSENSTINMEQSLWGLGESLYENGSAFDEFSQAGQGNMLALMDSMSIITEQSGGDASTTAANMQALYDNLVSGGNAPAAMLEFLATKINELMVAANGKVSDVTMPELKWATSSNDGYYAAQARANERASNSASRAADRESQSQRRAQERAAKSAKKAQVEVRTLTDYANDLAAVWNRAFEIRFSGQTAEDSTTKLLTAIRDKAAAAKKTVEDLKLSLLSLNAGIGALQAEIDLQKYFLTIDVEYKDDKRADQRRATIAELEAEMAGKRGELSTTTKELTTAQDAQTKSLLGNSAGAISNREDILGLVSSYQDQIQALANSGMSADALRTKTEALRKSFVAQGTQLGFSRTELRKYEGAFADVRTAIDKVPRNITVTGNINPAVQALNELRAKASRAATDAGNAATTAFRNQTAGLARGTSIPITYTTDTSQLRRGLLQTQDAYQTQLNAAYKASGNNSNVNTGRLEQAILAIKNKLKSAGFANGGYTGAGGKYDVAGPVHRGEYVIPKRDVNQSTGLPTADALGRLLGRSQGSPSSGASNVVELGVGTIRAIATLVSNTVILDGKRINQAVQNQSTIQGTIGEY